MPRGTPPRGRQPITLEGFHSYFDLERCLTFIAQALQRADMEPGDLPPYQYQLYSDLHDPLDEDTLADMLAYWNFDQDKLFKRGRRGWGIGRAPAKPQIDVWVEITSKGNLKAEWLPRGASIHYIPPGSDFLRFNRQESRTVAYSGRPTNELFFLHEFERAHSHLAHPISIPTAPLDTPLLAACAKVVERLKERLAYHFDVRMRTDVFVEWAETGIVLGERFFSQPKNKMVSWSILDPEERQRTLELDELDNLEERLGFSEEAVSLTKRQLEARPKGATGPAPSPHTLPERLARELKKQGFPATKGKVERALELIDRHRSPAIERFTDNVVSFRPNPTED